jgi:hypothetical protein
VVITRNIKEAKDMYCEQGCQMVHFRTKNPNLGKFCRVLQWKMFVYFTAIWYILRPFGMLVGHFDMFSRFGMLYQE